MSTRQRLLADVRTLRHDCSLVIDELQRMAQLLRDWTYGRLISESTSLVASPASRPTTATPDRDAPITQAVDGRLMVPTVEDGSNQTRQVNPQGWSNELDDGGQRV